MQFTWRHSALMALRVVAVLAIVLAVMLGALLWRLEQAPINLSFMRGALGKAVETQFGEIERVEIGELHLEKTPGQSVYRLILKDIAIEGAGGLRIGALEQAFFSFTRENILARRFAPRFVSIDGAQIEFTRRKGHRYTVDYAQEGKGLSLEPLFQLSQFVKDFLREAQLSNVSVIFNDEISGQSWRSTHAEGSVVRRSGGYQASLDAQFQLHQLHTVSDQEAGLQNGEGARIALTANLNPDAGDIQAALELERAPVSELLEVFWGVQPVQFTAPVSGKAAVVLNENGQITSSSLEGRVQGGMMHLLGSHTPLSALSVKAAFNPSTEQYTLDHLKIDSDLIQANLQGETQLVLGQDGQLERLAFDLVADQVAYDGRPTFVAPLLIPQAALRGNLNLVERQLEIFDLAIDYDGAVIKGNSAISFPAGAKGKKTPSIGIRFNVNADGSISRKAILAAWPVNAGDSARSYIDEWINGGLANNLSAKMELAPGALDEFGRLPKEALSVQFDLAKADVLYTRGLKRLVGARGKATITGDGMTIKGIRGRVGAVSITQGQARFTSFRAGHGERHYSFLADGTVGALLSVLNDEPVGVLRKTPYAPEQFSGRAHANIAIKRGTLSSDPAGKHHLSGTATFEHLQLDEILPGAVLSEASGRIKIKDDAMHVEATAALNEDRIAIDWQQGFNTAPGSTTFTVSGEATAALGDLFGLHTRRLVRGAVPFTATAHGAIDQLETVNIDADFTPARVFLAPLDWEKPYDEAMRATMQVDLRSDGTHVRSINVHGQRIATQGALSLHRDGSLSAIDFTRIQLDGAIDGRIKLEQRGSNDYAIEIIGQLLNIGGLLKTSLSAGADDQEVGKKESMFWESLNGLSLVARIDQLGLRENITLMDADITVQRRDGQFTAFDASAREGVQGVLTARLDRPMAEDEVENPDPVIEVRAENVGNLMRGLFGMMSVENGQGVLTLFPSDLYKDDESVMHGVLEARNIRIVGAPLLTRIFSAGSLGGLSDLLSGEGIELNQVFSDFYLHKNALILEDFRAAGASVGFTTRGRIAAENDGGLHLHGAIAPAYQLNALLGKMPLLGDLFVSRSSEGVVALSYHVTGNPAAPAVSVNPLSAITPGAMRRVFDDTDMVDFEPDVSKSPLPEARDAVPTEDRLQP